MSKYKVGDLFTGNFPITQYYDANPQSYPMFADPGHEGVDFGTPNGTPILAPFNGVILRDTFNDKDYGNFTVIYDPVQRCGVWYCHLLDIGTQLGQKVSMGQVVGHTNNTGHSTGPHLHVNFVETDNNGNRLNQNNGKQGFLNILDPNLVEWVKEGQTPPPVIVDTNQKEQLIIDSYKALTGDFPNDDEKKARLAQNLNTVDLITSLTGDGRFKQKFIQPEIQKKDDRIGELDGKIKKATTDKVEAEKANAIQAELIADLRRQLADVPSAPEELTKEDVGYLQGFIAFLKSYMPFQKSS